MVKIFGKALFDKKVKPQLYDFAQHGILRLERGYGMESGLVEFIPVDPAERRKKAKADAKKKAEEEKARKTQSTPKEIYQLGTLNTPELSIVCDPDYINDQVDILVSKLEALGPAPKEDRNMNMGFGETGAVKYGRQEVESMIERLENRTSFHEFGGDLSEYPYTTSDAIRNLLSTQKHLEAIVATPMIPDLPGDAIRKMNHYAAVTEKLCGKRPVFYLIKEKKDDKEVARRRDPILLAQSPFGFFWQILGAWDDEVKFLDEL